MKIIHIVIIAMSLVLISCSTSNDTDRQTNNENQKELLDFYKKIQSLDYWEQHGIIQKNIIQYFFNGTFLSNFYMETASTETRGIISRSAKDLSKKIWSSLEQVGFSGYSSTVLNSGNIAYVYRREGWPRTGRPMIRSSDTPSLLAQKYQEAAYIALPFHSKLINFLIEDIGIRYLQLKKASSSTERFDAVLIALQFNGHRIEWDVQKDCLQLVNSRKETTLIPEETLQAWNQIFVDALAQDPFFSQFFKPQTLPDTTGSVSLLAARTGKTGLDAVRLTVNGVPGSHMDLGLPIFVQLKGSVDQGKSTNLTTGTVAYKLGNTLVGAIQTYSNSGSGFGVDGRQLESSVVASHSFGSFFIEGQFGSISATDVSFNDWSGSRAQFTVGVDTSWVSPFVQVSYRNLNDQPDTAVYGGLEVDLSELRTDGYTVSTHLFTKAGYSNVKGTTGAVEWSETLTLNSGLSFSTNLTLGTAAEPSAGLTFKLDR